MPYRRLPNTDISRLKAMSRALQMSEGLPPFQLSFSIAAHQELKFFYPEFNQAINLQKESLERQVSTNKIHQDKLKKTRLYISHFIQVMNFAIIRRDLPSATRQVFKMSIESSKLPQLNTERDVIEWGEKLINGEQIRLSQGLTPISNPNIARVKVHYEDYLRTYRNQIYLQDAHDTILNNIVELRSKADKIIIKIWNEIEKHYSHLPAEEKRTITKEFGLVYVYRKNEKLNFNNIKFGV